LLWSEVEMEMDASPHYLRELEGKRRWVLLNYPPGQRADE
jgi:hypothetical protein